MAKKKEIETAKSIAIGAGVMFVLCLLIGLADKWQLLDPILDFLHIPK